MTRHLARNPRWGCSYIAAAPAGAGDRACLGEGAGGKGGRERRSVHAALVWVGCHDMVG